MKAKTSTQQKCWKTKYRHRRRRSFTLFEVVIAISIVSMCLVPLLYPHYAMLREETRFVKEIELDRVANLLYLDTLEELYRNYISWSDIESSFQQNVDDDRLKSLGYTGSRTIAISSSKPEKETATEDKKDEPIGSVDQPERYFLLETTFLFTPVSNKKKKIEYQYWAVADRKTSIFESNIGNENEDKNEKE